MFSEAILTYLIAAALLGHAQAAPAPQPGCREMKFSIHATADTIDMPPLPTLNSADDVLNYFIGLPEILATAGHKTTASVYKIATTYCPPSDGIANKVQLLNHGGTYTKEYWMGGAWGGADVYSWTKFANEHGFATLSVDQLGNGDSEHPDPLQEAQLIMEVEILKFLAQKIKDGDITGAPSEVIFVGHALGSVTGSMLAAAYPNTVDKLVLTSYSNDFSNITANVVAGQYTPASIVDPTRFGKLPPGYLTQPSVSARGGPFYSGDFDQGLLQLDFDTKGTLALGEVLNLTPIPLPNYTGPVFLLTGDEDKLFCGSNPHVPCQSVVRDSASLFPSARNFGFFVPKKTGVVLNFHQSAPKSFDAVTDWLLHASN